MKTLNLKEFAESLLLGENDRHRDFAQEILENLDFVDNSKFDELCGDIAGISEKEFKNHEPLKQIDRIGDRLNSLDEIKDELQKHGFDGDTDDEVRKLIEVRRQIEEMLQNAGLWTDGDLYEVLCQLVERAPQYDL